MNLQEVYRPLTERTLENLQVNYLGRKFDFGKESRVARLIVQEVNEAMDAEDDCMGIDRVQPFELLVHTHHRFVRLPLFRDEYLDPIFNGQTFAGSRKVLQQLCLDRLRQAHSAATEQDLLRFIDPWALARYKGPTRMVDEVKTEARPYDEPDTKQWQATLDGIQPVPPTERMQTPDLSAPEGVVHQLSTRIAEELGLGQRIARYMVEELITLRNVCRPRVPALSSGQMVLITTHVNAPLSEEIATQYRRHTPVIITVWEPDELRKRALTVGSCLTSLKKRIIRVCFEAYRQNGLLSLQQLQWIFQISTARISELIRSFQKEHNIIVPTPGTILDAGRSMTHKDIIVRLHLQGYSVTEISRITYHSPRAVDNYIGTFESVLILHLFSLPPPLMGRLLQKGKLLIGEYLQLIDEFYKDKNQVKTYLQLKGVRF